MLSHMFGRQGGRDGSHPGSRVSSRVGSRVGSRANSDADGDDIADLSQLRIKELGAGTIDMPLRSAHDALGRDSESTCRHALDAAIRISRKSDRTVAFLGPEYTYSHEAAMHAFGESFTFLPKDDFKSVVAAVKRCDAFLGIMPIENSHYGIVADAVDEWREEQELLVFKEIQIAVEIKCVSRSNSYSDIERVASHPQIFGQCKEWLSENLPNAERTPVSSSAQAVQFAVEDKHTAALANSNHSFDENLDILDKDIQDSKENRTRFICFARRNAVAGFMARVPERESRFWIRMNLTEHEVARYCFNGAMNIFHEHQLAVNNVYTRPQKYLVTSHPRYTKYMSPFKRVFFIELIGKYSKLSKALQKVDGDLNNGHCRFLGFF